MDSLEKRKKDNSPVAENLKRIIEERALHQPEIARRAALEPRNLCDIINGQKLIRAREIEALVGAIGIDVGELFMRDANDDEYII